MAQIEVADLARNTNMFELAEKTLLKMDLTAEEKEARNQLDAYFRHVGKTGEDPNAEIAAFLSKVVNEEIYNTPDELLEAMFDIGTIGEYDDYESTVLPPKNTLIAHEAAVGGNVERSYLDISVLKPTWKNYQIETDVSFADLERGGWKTVALLTDYATRAFKNRMFKDILDVVDAAIVNGAENYILASSSMPTQTAADQLALYLNDRTDGGSGMMVARSKYIQTISKFPGFLSDDLINEINRTGRLGTYDGCSLVPISSAKKLGDGSFLIPDKRIFGIAGKIGTISMKGSIKTYQDEQHNKEVVHLMFKNFSFGYGFNKDTLENVAKIVLD